MIPPKHSVISICLLLLFVSCNKFDVGRRDSVQQVKEPEAADPFVGTWDVSVIEQTTWGAASGTINDAGVMSIYKTSASTVQCLGFVATKGTIAGKKLYLQSEHTEDVYGYIDTVYDEGILEDDVLTFYSVMTGQLAQVEYGTRYPFRAVSKFIAIRRK